MGIFKKFKNQKEKQQFVIKTAVLLVILFVTSIIVDTTVKPTIDKVSSHQAKVLVTEIVNKAVYSELVQTEYTYANFVNLAQDKDGNVTSLETDVTGINRLKARITKRLLDEFELLSEKELSIPSGSLLGPYFLMGKGPDVPYRILYSGDIDVSFSNKFENAGINQTRHQIILTITLNVSSILPGHTSTVTVPSGYYVANTVIVGKVPESFTEVVTEEEIPSIINDYVDKK